jgi:sulfide:quinone oxidoreductase
VRRLVVLGGGTAGTMLVNKLVHLVDRRDWEITLVDEDDRHVYQPGLLLVPFGRQRPDELIRPRTLYLPGAVRWVHSRIERVDPDARLVLLADRRELPYDYLVIATGTWPRPEQTAGMTGREWRRSIFDFYTLEGAVALRDKLAHWHGGKLVVHITEMPIKCPVAPLEFALLADAFFAERGMRQLVDITLVTPMGGAFTKPVASRRLGAMLDERTIRLEPDFVVDRIDPMTKQLISFDDRRVGFDLLVTVPVNMGADYVGRSGLGDELNHVPVDEHTLLSTRYDTIFAVGDAASIPTSKAGSVAHFEVECWVHNFLDHVAGRPMTHTFDGHANCFVESGHGKGVLIDFNYTTEPLPGRYPLPGFGPFDLLAETRRNHWGKLATSWIYWHVLLHGRRLPLPTSMSMTGKHPEG